MGGLWHLTHWRWERCLLAVGPHFNTFCCYHPLAVGTLLTFGLNMLPSCPLAVGICLLFAAFSWMFTQWCPQWLYITHWRWESVRCSPIASLICPAIFTPGGGNKNLNAACSITCTIFIEVYDGYLFINVTLYLLAAAGAAWTTFGNQVIECQYLPIGVGNFTG